MRPGAAAARRTIATTRLAVLRTGDALLGYGGLTQALWRNKEDGSQLVLVAVEADDSPDTLFDGLSDDSLMAAADAVLEGYGADLAPTAAAARIGAAKLVPGAAARAHFDSVSVSTGGFVGPGARYEPALWGQARLLATVLVVGDDGTVHVRIRGRAADNADLRGGGATLVDEDADGYIVNRCDATAGRPCALDYLNTAAVPRYLDIDVTAEPGRLLWYQVGGYTLMLRERDLTVLDMKVEDAMRSVLTAGVAGR